MKYLIIGDTHGVLYKVNQLEHLFSTVDKVIFVGDYVDRGPDCIGVLKLVLGIPNAVRLCGNHELKYWRKHKKGKPSYPADVVTPEQQQEFTDLLMKVGGDKPQHWYKDDNIGVSHAPAALWQHNWVEVPPERFAYGWTLPTKDPVTGFPARISLEDKYPGETSHKPVIVGHIHSDKIVIGTNIYCVDLQCGQENGRLGAVIVENSTVIEEIII